jgi:hypothetical protein
MMDELALPESIRRKASITPGGEHAWRIDDVEDVIAAARAIGLACLGGQVQFQFPEGTCEAYWLSYNPAEQRPGELWQEYVSRSADETLAAFRRVRSETDFRAVARGWAFIQQKIDMEGCDPIENLWFVLYIQGVPTTQDGDSTDRLSR